jgi:general secretion pathway protein C
VTASTDAKLSWPLRVVQTLLTTIALGLLAVTLAYWFWKFYALSVEQPPAPAPALQGDMTAQAAKLFGGNAVPLSKEAVNVALVLKGALATGEGRGTAVLAGTELVAGKLRDRTARVGDELAVGVKLAGIYPTWIEVETASGKERIDLDLKSRGQQLARAGVGVTTAGTAGGTVTAVTNSFALDVTRAGDNLAFSRRQLDNTLKDASMLNRLGQVGPAPAGGARVAAAPSGSLLERLGLQTGDVITSINGTRVNTPGDLANLYQQFATTNRISAEVTRQGATIRLAYTVNP